MSNFNKIEIGRKILYALIEEEGDGRIDVLVGASQDVIEQYAPTGLYPRAVNAYLLNDKGTYSLFDTGFGRHIFEQMDELSVSSSDIHNIYLTHLHPDHIGGLLHQDSLVFPNANLYLSQAEYDYWKSDEQRRIAGQQKAHYFDTARKMLDLYQKQLRIQKPININQALGSQSDICMIEAYGHTPGHVMYMIQGDTDKLIVGGDLIHALSVQLPHPEVAVMYDVDASQAIKTRHQILELISKLKIPIAGMHIPFGGVVIVAKKGSGFDYTLCR